MRDLKIFFLPDMWNDWHWFVYDADYHCIAQSNFGHFHLKAAQDEAEAVMRKLAA
ncbi:hypothetical protein [Novosphingobium resinovorum]|uniref:hypothetical protein n=1 Tax=Novosphingobium resinovorum TaxID=158500 RepID=UPI0012EA6153|nr:hypothetical protein [Novosphingobium resinovorum]